MNFDALLVWFKRLSEKTPRPPVSGTELAEKLLEMAEGIGKFDHTWGDREKGLLLDAAEGCLWRIGMAREHNRIANSLLRMRAELRERAEWAHEEYGTSGVDCPQCEGEGYIGCGELCPTCLVSMAKWPRPGPGSGPAASAKGSLRDWALGQVFEPFCPHRECGAYLGDMVCNGGGKNWVCEECGSVIEVLKLRGRATS